MAWAGLGTDYQDAATLLKNRAKPVPHQLYEYQTWLFLKITSNLSISRKYGSVMNDPYGHVHKKVALEIDFSLPKMCEACVKHLYLKEYAMKVNQI